MIVSSPAFLDLFFILPLVSSGGSVYIGSTAVYLDDIGGSWKGGEKLLGL